MAESEIQERTAKLNTQLRFGRHGPALMEAYKLRTFIQLRGAKTHDAKQELHRVEKVIAELERNQDSLIQKIVKSIIQTIKDSLNPEKEHQETLLDLFADDYEEEEEEDEYGDEQDEYEEARVKPEEQPLGEYTPNT